MKDSTLTSRYRITVPKAVRDALEIGPGDKVGFVPAWRGFHVVAIKRGFINMDAADSKLGGKPVRGR